MLHAKKFIFVFAFSLLSTYNVIVLHILTHYTLYITIIVVVKSYELLLLYYSINITSVKLHPTSYIKAIVGRYINVHEHIP